MKGTGGFSGRKRKPYPKANCTAGNFQELPMSDRKMSLLDPCTARILRQGEGIRSGLDI